MQELESALAVMQSAIHNEIAGQQFYNNAAYSCIDPWAKEIFAALAKEEEVHTRLLLLEYEALSTEGRWIDLETARASDSPVDITRFSFPDDEPAEELFPLHRSVEGAVDRQADDLAALAFGIKMEERAIALYGQATGEVGDRTAQEVYEFLVQEETRHYHELKAQWETLAGMPFRGS